MNSDREVLCFLQHIQGIGNKTIKALWSYFKTGNEILNAGEKELDQILNKQQKSAFLTAKEQKTVTEQITELRKKGIDFYTVFDWNYPRRLRTIPDAPLALYVKGSLPSETQMTASVIGARKHSYYGEKYARQFSGILAEEGIGVISGMAKGIDSIAQMTAMECGGKSYAVLGCGVDICYPEENRKVYEKLHYQGGIISEYPPGTRPSAGLFPLRNRIISALGDILLVMEARERSGTLITVDMALEQGKEIWALPGRCDDVLSYGCNRLIAQGAGVLSGEAEFREELALLKQKYEGQFGQTQTMKKSSFLQSKDTKPKEQVLEEIEKVVLSLLDYQPQSLNELYTKIQQMNYLFSMQKASMALVELCIKGLARQVNGNFYIKA